MTSSPLPMTTPEDIGLSSSALTRLGKVLSGEVATGRLPGAVALIARRGRVALFESFGQRDPASGWFERSGFAEEDHRAHRSVTHTYATPCGVSCTPAWLSTGMTSWQGPGRRRCRWPT